MISPNTPGGTRTPNPRFRRPMLYPIELRAHVGDTSVARPADAGLAAARLAERADLRYAPASFSIVSESERHLWA